MLVGAPRLIQSSTSVGWNRRLLTPNRCDTSNPRRYARRTVSSSQPTNSATSKAVSRRFGRSLRFLGRRLAAPRNWKSRAGRRRVDDRLNVEHPRGWFDKAGCQCGSGRERLSRSLLMRTHTLRRYVLTSFKSQPSTRSPNCTSARTRSKQSTLYQANDVVGSVLRRFRAKSKLRVRESSTCRRVGTR